jgi:hypothetical protein
LGRQAAGLTAFRVAWRWMPGLGFRRWGIVRCRRAACARSGITARAARRRGDALVPLSQEGAGAVGGGSGVAGDPCQGGGGWARSCPVSSIPPHPAGLLVHVQLGLGVARLGADHRTGRTLQWRVLVTAEWQEHFRTGSTGRRTRWRPRSGVNERTGVGSLQDRQVIEGKGPRPHLSEYRLPAVSATTSMSCSLLTGRCRRSWRRWPASVRSC